MLEDNIESLSTWFLIYTKPKQEKVAETNLVRQGYRVYLPYVQLSKRRQGGYQMISEPMFPPYLFIYLNPISDNWAPIRSTKGVTSLVRFGGMPAKVPTPLIEFLMKNQENKPSSEPTVPEFKQGESIQILDGVMAGYQGLFEAKSGTKRVTVLLDIVGKAMKVEVPIDAIGRSE